jgi:primosomal protein N' (replication factor Y)
VAVEGVRAALAETLNVEVGMVTSGARQGEGAAVVVATARHVSSEEWDLVAVPDADALLFGGGMDPVEAGFRVLYRASEASRRSILVQTRRPEHPALLAALRGDYEGFAADHLPMRRTLGYPPHGHGAEVVVALPEAGALRAVESGLREAAPGRGVEWAGPVPIPGERETWRVLLRGRRLAEVAGTAARLGRYLAKSGVGPRITVDPEEA